MKSNNTIEATHTSQPKTCDCIDTRCEICTKWMNADQIRTAFETVKHTCNYEVGSLPQMALELHRRSSSKYYLNRSEYEKTLAALPAE